jgi:membrane associated rhomboid family serine protease
MLLARQRLILSYGRLVLQSPSPITFCRYRLPGRLSAIQVRLKSINRKSAGRTQRGGQQRPAAENDTINTLSSQNNRWPKKDSTQNARLPSKDSELQPIRPGKPKQAEVFEQLTSKSQMIFDFINWRYSRIFLTVVLNSTAFIVYCMWTYEAYKASQAKEAIKRGETVDPARGRLVTESEGKEKFLTPGQEWLLDNFTVTPINLREGRYWTVITSLFSHQLPLHIVGNMVFCHVLCTSLCPRVGTVPIALAFLIGGVSGNLMTVLWQGKRGGTSYDEKYPGQFFGTLGMSGANYAMMGFGTTAWPNWFISVFGVWRIRVGHLVIGAWLFEAFQYWRQEGWEKIQSSVRTLFLWVY